MNVNNNFIAMKNIIQISLATMTGVAIGAISTFSLFATDIISFPDAPS